MSTNEVHAERCAEIAPIRYDHEVMTFEKVKDQSDYTTFVAWARNNARKLCEHGACLKGRCRGHLEMPEWEVLEETEESFTCQFSGEIFCRCG